MARKHARQPGTPAAAMQPAATPAREDRVSVVFARRHTHAGIDYLPGDVLLATRQERALLLHFDAIEVE